jgi:outer membrane protein OmpA-like peptidoglycan-associated protein
METVMEMARAAMSSGGLDRLATLTHEPRDKTKRGFEEALPVSIMGLADKAAHGDGAQELLRNLKTGNYPQLDARDIAHTTGDPVTTERLVHQAEGASSQLFGSRTGGIVDRLATDSGVSKGTAAKLLGIATSMVMGIVGKTVVSRNLDAAGLSRYLGEQKRSASVFVPGGVARQVEPAVKEVPVARRTSERVVERPAEVHERAGFARYLPWILGALALLGLFLWVSARRDRQVDEAARARPVATAPQPEPVRAPPPATPEPVRAPPPATPEPARPATAPVVAPAATGEPSEVAGPRAAPEPAPAAAVSVVSVSELGGFLASDAAVPRRFVMDGVTFRQGSDTITQSSSAVLDTIAATLDDHPTARVQIEGHADATGSPELNQALSADRALAAKEYLVEQGVSANRIETSGLGSTRPITSGESASGQAENRRLDLVVLER